MIIVSILDFVLVFLGYPWNLDKTNTGLVRSCVGLGWALLPPPGNLDKTNTGLMRSVLVCVGL